MNIRYTDDLKLIDHNKLKGFFVGWDNPPSSEKHFKILCGSFKVWLALDSNQCVGFINAISDGFYSAFIPFLEVLPNFQGKGIGSELTRLMSVSLEDHYSIDVVCDLKVSSFYKSNGFSQLISMSKRNRKNQD